MPLKQRCHPREGGDPYPREFSVCRTMDSRFRGNDKAHISIWLFACAALVFLIVIIGGLTRLSESGLSIVSWQPVKGVIPPLDVRDWQNLFAAYKQTPQYLKINYDMSLEEFKNIFWLEYIHRVLGRIIGLVFLVPLLFFIITKKIGKNLALKLFSIALLGALQGFIGWYMVKSGLVDNPAVSHYRLALHLFLGFVIYAMLLWAGLNSAECEVQSAEKATLNSALRTLHSLAISAFILFQTILGAFVSGTHAGLIYNDFPLMGGHIIPEDIFFLHPLWLNFLQNPATIQFQHRMMAFILFILILIFRVKNPGDKAAGLLLAVALIQVLLGILTLVNHVPVLFAAAHQAGALVLFSVSLFINYRLYAISQKS